MEIFFTALVLAAGAGAWSMKWRVEISRVEVELNELALVEAGVARENGQR